MRSSKKWVNLHKHVTRGAWIELADLDQCKGITDSLTLKIYKTNTGKVQNSIHLLNIHDEGNRRKQEELTQKLLLKDFR